MIKFDTMNIVWEANPNEIINSVNNFIINSRNVNNIVLKSTFYTNNDIHTFLRRLSNDITECSIIQTFYDFLQAVHPNRDIRKVANECSNKISKHIDDLN